MSYIEVQSMFMEQQWVGGNNDSFYAELSRRVLGGEGVGMVDQLGSADTGGNTDTSSCQ
jgi:hypothetical protein